MLATFQKKKNRTILINENISLTILLLTVNYYIRHTKHSAKHLADKHQSIVLAISIIYASLKLKSFLCGFKKKGLMGRRTKIK